MVSVVFVADVIEMGLLLTLVVAARIPLLLCHEPGEVKAANLFCIIWDFMFTFA